jgi:type III secretion protein L
MAPDLSPDLSDAPAPPRLKPVGPVIRAQEAGLWSETEAAVAEARAYGERMRGWIAASHRQEKERGFAEGWEAGAAEAARLVAATAARTELYARELERDLPGLVLGLVERVLGSFDPGEVLTMAVRHAVDKVRTGAEITIRVSSDYAEILRQALADPGRFAGASTLRVEADPALASGACVLESEFGNVDLGIEAQLKALREGLAQVWDAPEAETSSRQDGFDGDARPPARGTA